MAGRKPYTITQVDYANARRYLDNAMQRGDVSTAEGYIAYRQAYNAEALQAWCDDYLPDATWNKLKNAILAARKRSRDYGKVKQKKGIALDHLAHLRLTTLAEETGKTLSETILMLEETYWLTRDNGLLKKSLGEVSRA